MATKSALQRILKAIVWTEERNKHSQETITKKTNEFSHIHYIDIIY